MRYIGTTAVLCDGIAMESRGASSAEALAVRKVGLASRRRGY